jgi:hypothetical protein
LENNTYLRKFVHEIRHGPSKTSSDDEKFIEKIEPLDETTVEVDEINIEIKKPEAELKETEKNYTFDTESPKPRDRKAELEKIAIDREANLQRIMANIQNPRELGSKLDRQRMLEQNEIEQI